MKYEDGVTHLLCSDDMSEGDFLKHSGFGKVEDVPESVMPLHVKWLYDSLTVSRPDVHARAALLTPVTAVQESQTRGPVSLSEEEARGYPAETQACWAVSSASDQADSVNHVRPVPSLSAERFSLRRYDPTDSETPESNRPLPPGLTLQPQKGRLERREEPEPESSASPRASDADGLDQVTEEIEEGDISAEAAKVPEKRFWLPPGIKADPLDEVISGIVSGTIAEDDEVGFPASLARL